MHESPNIRGLAVLRIFPGGVFPSRTGLWAVESRGILNPWTNLILNPSFPLPPLCLFNRFVSSPLLSSFAFPSLRKAWNFLDAYLRLPYVSFLMSDYFVLRCCPDEKIHIFSFEKWGSDILGTVDFSYPAYLLLRHLVWDISLGKFLKLHFLNVCRHKEKTRASAKAYPAIWPRLTPITQPSLGLSPQNREDLSEMWPNRRAKFHADR